MMPAHPYLDRVAVSIPLLGLWILLGSGCQTNPSAQPPYAIAPGSRVVLHQSLAITPQATHVTLQHGRVAGDAASRFDPRCRFTITRLSDEPQHLLPEAFVVERITQYRRPFGMGGRQPGALRVAGFGWSGLFDPGRELDYVTDMKLRSETQPDIRRLICLITDDPLGRFLTLSQIRETLGEIASIEPGD